MIRALPRVALQLWIVLFIVFFGAEVIHIEPRLRVLTQVLYGVPLVGWALWRIRAPLDRLDLSVLGLLVLYAAVCLFGRDRTESLNTLALAAAYAALFLTLRREAVGPRRQSILIAVTIGLSISLLYNAWLLIDEKLTWIASVGSAPFEGVVVFPWQSANAMPMVVLLAIPGLVWLEGGLPRRLMVVGVAASSLVVVPLSVGRAGWLALGVTAVVAVVLWTRARRTFGSPRAMGMAVGGTIGAIVAVILLAPRVITSLAETGRLLLWSQGVAMVQNRPLLGSGPGAHSWARLDFPPDGASMLAVPLVHNVTLQTLIDGGVLLGLLLAATAGLWTAEVWKRRGHMSTADRVSTAVVVGWVASTTLDDFSYLPALTALVLMVAAFLTPVREPSMQTTNAPPSWGAIAVVGLAAGLSLPSMVAVDVARNAAQAARTEMTASRYEAAAGSFEVAIRAHPENGGYWLGLGMARSYVGNEASALDAYRQAIEVSSGDPRGYGGAAALTAGSEQKQLLRAAADRTLGDPQYAVRLGVLLAAQGDARGAAAAWARAAALSPQVLRLLPYAGTGIRMESIARDALEELSVHPRPGPAENFERIWDLELAIDELASDAHPAWLAVDAARRGNLTAATQYAEQAVADARYEGRGYNARAAVAAYACDEAAAAAALDVEAKTRHPYVPREPDPRIAREFVYREVGLGASQPMGTETGFDVPRWPWALVDRPSCDQ